MTWLVLCTIVGGLAACAPSPTHNLALNPSFEIEDEGVDRSGTGIAEWWTPYNQYDWDSTVSRTGTHSLHVFEDGSRRGASATVRVRQWTAAPVTISAWSKASNVAEGGHYYLQVACWFMDDAREGPAVVLSPRAHFTRGTHDWERATITIPDAANSRRLVKRVVVYLRFEIPEPAAGAPGEAWFDDVSATHTIGPGRFPSPPGTVSIESNNDLRVDGQPFLPRGLLGIRSYWDYREADPSVDAIIEKYGKTFFDPANMARHLDEVRSEGFNLIGVTAGPAGTRQHLQMILDQARSRGMKVLIHLAPSDYHRIEWIDNLPRTTYTFRLNRVRDLVSVFKSHPALLGWYIFDEPGHCWFEALPACPTPAGARDGISHAYNAIKAEDGDHPVVLVTGDWVTVEEPGEAYAHVGQRAEVADILVPDSYPIRTWPPGSASPVFWRHAEYTEIIRRTREAVNDRKPVWVVLQAWPGGAASAGAIPTPEQERAVTYQALSAGAKGLLYFTYQIEKAVPGQKDWFLPAVAPAMWDAFSTLFEEVDSLTPPVLSGPIADGAGVWVDEMQPDAVTGKDAWIRSDGPNQALGEREEMWAGVWHQSYDYRYRLLVGPLDMSSIAPGRFVTQAALKLRYFAAGQATSSIETVHVITDPWDEGTVTWNTQPAYGAWQGAHQILGGGWRYGGWESFDLTAVARAWRDGSSAHGVMIKDAWEVIDVEDEAFTVSVADTVRVQRVPMRRMSRDGGLNPPPRGWGVWLATDPTHTGTNYMSGGKYDYRTGEIAAGTPLAAGTRVLVNYSYSWNDQCRYYTSDHSDPAMRPKLVVISSDQPPTGNAPKPLVEHFDIDGRVHSSATLYNGKVYILSAHVGDGEREITFEFRPAATGLANVLFEGRVVPVTEGKFTDTFAGYESHVYEISL